MKRKNGVLYTLLIAFFVYAVLTWILPVTTFNTEFTNQGMVRMGVTEVLSYPTYTFYNFIYVLMYLALVCCLYGLLRKIPAYHKLVSKVVNIVKDKIFIFCIFTIALFSLIISFTGHVYEALVIMPFLATVLLKAGKDKFTAGLITVGPIAIGVMGNMFASKIAGVFVSGLAINYTDLVIAKVLFLLIGVVVLAVTLKLHDKKEIEEDNSDVFFLYEEEKNEGKVRIWPLATLLITFLLIKIISSISWNEAFSLTFFEEFKTTIDAIPLFTKYISFIFFGLIIIGLLIKYIINKKKDSSKKLMEILGKMGFSVLVVCFTILGLVFIKVLLEDVFKVTVFFSKIYTNLGLENVNLGTFIGSINPFGSWTYAEYMLLLIVLCLILKFAYRIKFAEIIENAGYGLKGGLYALVLCMIGYLLLVTTSNNPIMLTILKPILKLTEGFNVLTYSLITFISGLFNTDFTYYQYGIINLTYVTTTFGDKTNLFPLIGLINQSMYGLAILVAPTSIPMIFSLGTLNYSYKKWIKYIWKLFLAMFVAALLINVIVLILI